MPLLEDIEVEEVLKPWGSFRLYNNNQTCTVKTLIVNLGKRLSDQRHQQRDEFWVIHCGKVKVSLENSDGAKEFICQEGDEVFVPKQTWHRIECLAYSPCPARVTEISFGHFDEDDIERRADDFGRV